MKTKQSGEGANKPPVRGIFTSGNIFTCKLFLSQLLVLFQRWNKPHYKHQRNKWRPFLFFISFSLSLFFKFLQFVKKGIDANCLESNLLESFMKDMISASSNWILVEICCWMENRREATKTEKDGKHNKSAAHPHRNRNTNRKKIQIQKQTHCHFVFSFRHHSDQLSYGPVVSKF